ncbi:TetR family transcriptional regulator [Tessaracoccus lubricantis]|uniref:TetR family transcriptional regulator n=1 Tax=Tessaracoccus lubricantis TaxID=545543 RepID=A0ABP9FB56_9ACTN
MARRHDPERRDRIIDACLDVIAEHGVAGASHRRVAAAADVPLGSMTYHFEGIDELLYLAFERFSIQEAAHFERRMHAATTFEEAIEAMLRITTEDVFDSQRDLILTHELYALAARRPEFRELCHRWMGRSRAALERQFDARTARILDALNEGLTTQRALDTQPWGTAVVVDAIQRVTRSRQPPSPRPDDGSPSPAQSR